MNRHYKTLRVVNITGKMLEVEDALKWAYSNGYRTLTSRPLSDRKFHYDISRYHIVAEKRIKPPIKV